MLNLFKGERPLWQNILIGAGFFALFLFGFGLTYFGFKFSKIFVKNPETNTNSLQNSFSKATPVPIPETPSQKGVYNILFLGYGGGNHDGPLLTDSMIVVHVDTNTHKSALISVPRDLWVTGNKKINSVGITGFQNSGPVVQDVTGLPINYFVSIDFSGFTKLVDDLGGIAVNVPKTFDDSFYPILGQENNTCAMTADQVNSLKAQYTGFDLENKFTCRYEHLHFDQGPASIDGTTALKFVRSRHGDSDFGRSLRQFAVLIGIENKLISLKSVNKLDSTIDTLSAIVRTDLTPGIIKSLIQVFGDPSAYKIIQIQLTTDNVLNQGMAPDGEFILYPKAGMFNFAGIKNYINANI